MKVSIRRYVYTVHCISVLSSRGRKIHLLNLGLTEHESSLGLFCGDKLMYFI